MGGRSRQGIEAMRQGDIAMGGTPGTYMDMASYFQQGIAQDFRIANGATAGRKER